MATLVLGPMLRYVGEDEATVWVETDAACEVEVLGHRARTFGVEGHHYAIVTVSGLRPATATPYEVRLDGEPAWPPPSWPYPEPTIRTLASGRRWRAVFGSCRTFHRADDEADDPDRIDALREYAVRAAHGPPVDRPDALVFLGDQVYAEKGSPGTRAFIRSRRDIDAGPGDAAADFEEYTRLYQESWSDPPIRWLLSTVASAMIFDDHDLIDNWNISAAWVETIRRKPWWQERATGALMAYWLYQHVGNLPPAALADDDLLRRLHAAGDRAGPILRHFAASADHGTHGTPGAQWSYARRLGPVVLAMVDSRNGRLLREGRQEMIDRDEWAWLEGEVAGAEHLLIGTSMPWLMPVGIHHLEAWVTALCAGAWGRPAAVVGERFRQWFQFNHWPAFPSSFDRLAELLRAVAAGERGPPPRTVVVLSGDVHYSYLAEAVWPATPGQPPTRVWQAVSSPLRYDLERSIRGGFRAGMSRAGRVLGRALAAGAGVPRPTFRWRLLTGPWFRNVVGSVDVDEDGVAVAFEHTTARGEPGGRLAPVARFRIGPRGAWAQNLPASTPGAPGIRTRSPRRRAADRC